MDQNLLYRIVRDNLRNNYSLDSRKLTAVQRFLSFRSANIHIKIYNTQILQVVIQMGKQNKSPSPHTEKSKRP
jgi:hypothetical protein